MTLTTGGAAEPVTVRSAASAPEWVVFGCGAHRFALPVERVREITTPLPATRLPGCGPETVGLVALRGGIVTAFDFGAAFGVGVASSSDAERRMLLVEHDGRIVGFVVDRVHGVARGDAATLTLDAQALREVDVEREGVLGVGIQDGHAYLAVDADLLLDRLLA